MESPSSLSELSDGPAPVSSLVPSIILAGNGRDIAGALFWICVTQPLSKKMMLVTQNPRKESRSLGVIEFNPLVN